MTDQEWTVLDIKDEVADDVSNFERDKVLQWLKDNGYDGLWFGGCCEPCGCDFGDFAPCCDGPGPDCEAAHKRDDGMHPGRRL